MNHQHRYEIHSQKRKKKESNTPRPAAGGGVGLGLWRKFVMIYCSWKSEEIEIDACEYDTISRNLNLEKDKVSSHGQGHVFFENSFRMKYWIQKHSLEIKGRQK